MATTFFIPLSTLSHDKRIDSKYYQLEYLEKDNYLTEIGTSSLKSIAYVTDGEHGSVNFVPNGIKYLTAENIKKGYVDISKIRYIGSATDEKNRRARVEIGNILFSIKGTLGEVALATDELLPANMNRDVAIIKLYDKSVLPEFVVMFLMSKYGRYQAEREGSGGVQQMVTLERLRQFKIPYVDRDKQLAICNLYKSSLGKKQASLELYTQATQLLEQELGLDKLQFKSQKSYTANFSEVVNNNRADADYYQIKYRHIKDYIIKYKHGYESLLSNVNSLEPNFTPSSRPNDIFNYIELSNINSSLGIISDSSVYTGKIIPSRARRKLYEGDLIFSSVVGSIDKSAIVTSKERDFIASTGFFHLRSDYYSPYFLIILLRSPLLINQFYQEATGGILSAVSNSNLRNIVIPLVPIDLQNEISELVKKSHKYYFESKQLLQQAIIEVETLIEQEAIKNNQA